MTSGEITAELLQAIWNRQGLGRVERVERPTRGMVNRAFVVNDRHVIRFDVLDDWGGVNRYAGEKWAYETLKGSGVPVPEVVALDSSKTLVPYDYLILSKVPGRTVIDTWGELSAEQRQHIAYSAGEYLAMIHGFSFDGFGLLFEIAAGSSKPTWAGYVADFYGDYGGQARRNGALSGDVADRIEAVIGQMQPLLATVTQGWFIHGDYHFENLLQQDGVITGVIDFEWAACGDAAWDFRIDEQLEETCPGSKAAFYAGYTSHRALPDYHETRVTFYKLMMYVDYVSFCFVSDKSEYAITLPRLMAALAWLEKHL